MDQVQSTYRSQAATNPISFTCLAFITRQTAITHYMTMFSGSTHYNSSGQYRHRGGTHARIDLSITDTNANGDGMSGVCTIINPHNTAHWTGCLWSGYKLDNGSLQDAMDEGRSGVLTQKNNIDKVRLGLAYGTWNDGDWVLYGVNT